MLQRNMPIPRVAKPGRFRPEHLLRPASVLVLGAETAAGAHLAALPSTAELAVVCAEGDAVRDAVQALGRVGTTAAIVLGMASGLRELALATGVRSLGP